MTVILKRYKRRFLKIIPLIMASLGLFWQIHSISRVYFQFTTRVDIAIEVPYKISMPGLTVCVALEDSLGAKGSQMKDSELVFLPIRDILAMSSPEVTITCDVPAPELPRIVNDSGLICNNFAKPRITLQYLKDLGQVARCETFFHRHFNESPYMVIASDAKDFYHLQVNKVRNTSIYIFVHSPIDVLHVSEADTINLNILQTEMVVMSTTKFSTYFLQSPYRTDCYPYHEYEYGQWGCIYECRIQHTIAECPVWPSNVPAPPDTGLQFKLPNPYCQNRISDPDCFADKCAKQQCYNEYYTTTTFFTKERTDMQKLTDFYIRRPFGVEFVYNYVPRLAQIEYICYVASCFGIWFGISCNDVLKYIMDKIEMKWKNYRKTGKLSGEKNGSSNLSASNMIERRTLRNFFKEDHKTSEVGQKNLIFYR